MKTLVAMAMTDSHRLTWEIACHHHNFFNFDQIFLKLTDKVDMDKKKKNN